MNLAKIVLIGAALVMVPVMGCSSSKEGGKSTPPAAGAANGGKQSPPPTNNAGSTTQQVDQACPEAAVGYCACLPESDWFIDGTGLIYDVVCCDAPGNVYTLYACGNDFDCDDSGLFLTCVER